MASTVLAHSGASWPLRLAVDSRATAVVRREGRCSVTRQMQLGLFLQGTGNHPAAWRQPGAFDSFQDIGMVRQIAQMAERGKFDMIFMSDHLHADPRAHPSFIVRFEPLTMLAAVATATTHIGLGATVSTTYSDPFTVARMFA